MATKKLKSRASALIEKLYEDEAMNEARESSYRTVTFTFDAEYACMFASIAKRFGKSTSAFGSEVFEPMVFEMFQALDPADRLSVGKDTDVELDRYLQSKGMRSTDETGGAPKTWERTAEHLNQREQELN